MTVKMKSFGLLAGCTLAAGFLYATDYSETFEGSTHTWTGDGSQLTTDYTYSPSPAVGKPLPDENHAQVLVVEGDSSFDASTAGYSFTGSPLVDMMVQAAWPDDALEVPEEAHIAVAVDQTGKFNVYCGNKSGEGAGWHPLSATPYTNGTWVRVSLLFDYQKKLCQVRIDGQPMKTEYGYLKAGSTENGAWYPLVASGASAVGRLKVVGCTAIDDVVIAENADSYAIPANATTPSGLACKWLDAYGLAWDATTAAAIYDNSGLTVAQKYNACLSPFDDQTFAVKSVKATSSNITVGIPKTVATTGRKVVLEYGSTPAMGHEVDVTAGEQTVSIQNPVAGEVKYFRLKATAAASN